MALSNLIITMEEAIAKYGLNNLHHHSDLLPSLIRQVQEIKIKSPSILGSYAIPKHAEETYAHQANKPIVWTDIYKDPSFAYSITIFRLFKGGTMPLHDHPSIYGINYLLSGSIGHKSYDILDALDVHKGEFIGLQYPLREYLEDDAIMTLPQKENLHEFIATENSSILQILIPDFDHQERVCSYWEVFNDVNMDIKNDIIKKRDDLCVEDIIGLRMISEPRSKIDINVPFDGVID